MSRAWAALRLLFERHAAFAIGAGLLFTFCRWPPLNGWDEGFYVAQLTSALADRDLLVQDDLLRLANPPHQKLAMVTNVVDGGALLNTFSVGPAVLHASYVWPLFLGDQRPSALALRPALALGSLAMLTLTVLAMIALTERLGYSRTIARVAAVMAVACGPLAVFGGRAAVNSHLPSALLAAALCLSLLAWLERGLPRHALAAGLCAGLLTITRWQEAVFVLTLAPAAVATLAPRDARLCRVKGIALAGGAFALVVAIQLIAWHIQFDRWLLVPQGGAYMRWTHPAVLALLSSSYHGLLPWMPGFALGLLGLMWLKPAGSTPAQRLFVLGLMALVPLSIYLSACPVDWWAGASFGPRRLTSLTPLAALGLAHVLTWLRQPRLRWPLVAALCLWGLFAVTAQISGYDDLSVLFFGRTSSDSPHSLEAYAGVRWIDHWPSWPRMLRPGFTFSDAPRHVDRVVGLAAVLLLAGVLVAIWKLLRRSSAVQRIAVAVGLGWVAIACAWTASLPPNRTWNATWERTVKDGSACEEGLSLPSGLDDARHVVCAARAARSGDDAALRRHLGQVRRPAEYGVDEAALRLAVAQGSLMGS